MSLVTKVDFGKIVGKINPALHSSGFGPLLSARGLMNYDEELKSLHLDSARTHDWALINNGQRMIDTHFVFPLIKEDPSDPSNYYFEPSDAIIKLSRDIGLKIFYRLGTSIEHSGLQHFNSCPPPDYDKYAEILAGIVRHYNKGWANGFEYGIKYWEIWNEPDLGGKQCWNGTSDEFVKLFATVVKRLKTEFPDIKVGGPALTRPNQEYFDSLFKACSEKNVVPDFISWHCYGSNVEGLINQPIEMRKYLDAKGLNNVEMSLNEWHYILAWDGIQASASPEIRRRAFTGPTGHNNIDSAAFTLSVLAGLQSTPLDSAFFYGCRFEGAWGFLDENRSFNKNFYALRMFGEIVSKFVNRAECESLRKTIHPFAALSNDGKRACVLLTDYRGTEQILEAEIKGAKGAKLVSAVALDNERDAIPVNVTWRDDRLTYVKIDKGSVSLLVTFEL